MSARKPADAFRARMAQLASESREHAANRPRHISRPPKVGGAAEDLPRRRTSRPPPTPRGADAARRAAHVQTNPATLARDARILIDGGYRLERVVPVDQFLFSPEIEVVATFSR